MLKITPFLWFDNNAEEAINFYTSVFKNSKVVEVTRHEEGGRGPEGEVFLATFQIEGQEFIALNGGPHYTFTPAISMFVACDTQEEVDELWEKLSEGGRDQHCGWLKDKFGLSWQIIPKALTVMLADKDRARANRVMASMLKMTKIETEGLRKAYDQAD
jgi:predicted 3-demethylubiquinone-9 3-methyltransferase (glyoxalase superfamily)